MWGISEYIIVENKDFILSDFIRNVRGLLMNIISDPCAGLVKAAGRSLQSQKLITFWWRIINNFFYFIITCAATKKKPALTSWQSMRRQLLQCYLTKIVELILLTKECVKYFHSGCSFIWCILKACLFLEFTEIRKDSAIELHSHKHTHCFKQCFHGIAS